MAYRNRTNPRRDDVWFSDVRLVGHEEVRMNMHFEKEGREHTTWVTQPITMKLCTVRRLGMEIQKVKRELYEKLHEFDRAVSGGE